VPVSQNAAQNIPNPFAHQIRPSGKTIPVKDWGIQFSGDLKSKFSLAQFLSEIKLKWPESNLSRDDFWRSAHNLFKDAAKTWFMANKQKWQNWNQFEPDFIANFKPPNYDDRLWEQLRLRTQGRDERLNLYVAEMIRLFSLLENSPSPTEKLNFIKSRLNPFTLKNLPLSSIKNLDDLNNEGLKLEAVKSQIDRYREPSAPDNPVEPDYVYKGQKKPQNEKPQVSAVQTADNKQKWPAGQKQTARAPQNQMVTADQRPNWNRGGAARQNFVPSAAKPNPAFTRSPPVDKFCYNCDKYGHVFRFCPSPKINFFCFGCGQKGVSKRNCSQEKCRRSKNLESAYAHGGTPSGKPGNSANKRDATGNATSKKST
jgi:hypothetical protein